VRIAVAQFRSVALDVAVTLALSLRRLGEAAEAGADVVVFPELSLGGYALDRAMAGRGGGRRGGGGVRRRGGGGPAFRGPSRRPA
jgi:predicted amidohydrolase